MIDISRIDSLYNQEEDSLLIALIKKYETENNVYSSELSYYKILSYSRLGLCDTASKELIRAMLIDGTSPKILMAEGVVAYCMDNNSAAKKSLRKALFKDSSNTLSYYFLANVYMTEGASDSALYYLLLGEKKAHSFYIYDGLGRYYLNMKDMGNAEINIRKSLYLQPNYSISINNYGILSIVQRELDIADSCFTILTQREPWDPRNYYQKANIYLLKGDTINACENLRISIDKGKYKDAQNIYDILECGNVR